MVGVGGWMCLSSTREERIRNEEPGSMSMDGVLDEGEANGDGRQLRARGELL